MRKLSILLMALLLFSIPIGVFAGDNVNPEPLTHVGPLRANDGQVAPLRLDGTGAMVVGEGNGKFFEPTQRGQMFIYATASSGVLLAAPTTTYFGPAVWNPCGSGKDLAIIKVAVGDVSGTTVRGHIAYAVATNIGAQVGTGSPVPTATFVAPTNAYIGSGNASVMKFAPAAITWTAAPTYLSPMYNVAATTPGGSGQMIDLVDGSIVIAPCNAFVVGANAGITQTATVTVWGIESPIQLRSNQ